MSRRFSERIGLIEPRKTIQKGFVDERLHSRLWSTMAIGFWKHFAQRCDTNSDPFTEFVVNSIQDQYFGKPIDEIGYRTYKFVEKLKLHLKDGNWAEIYDLAQFLADFSKNRIPGEPYSQARRQASVFIAFANEVLEVEKSAYRFVGGELVEITSEEEIEEISQALQSDSSFEGAKTHLTTALQMFGDRENPDYRNAIKEAISSIESAYTTINGSKSKSLPEAMKKAEKTGLLLPPALATGIKNIYGWTSDESGVRHALISELPEVDEADAKLMIVLCSALLNYISLKQA